MSDSTCTISFFRNDLQRTKLPNNCPVKNCTSKLHKIAFQRLQVPYCPEHGVRIHSNGFVYHNGNSETNKITAIKRNLIFNPDYYISKFFRTGNKMESGRLCYESSEDAVSYNVFTGLLSDVSALKQLVKHITKEETQKDVDLYLWGSKINLNKGTTELYPPLKYVRELLESDIKRFKTEPDIMLVVPKEVVICIEAKFGSKNPIAKDKDEIAGEKPKRVDKLIQRYCDRNNLIKKCDLFAFDNKPTSVFYEQLFRNIVFAASMARLERAKKWYVVNLRNQHLMNLKRGKPESQPVTRSIHSILHYPYKKRFIHMTWEDIYNNTIKDNPRLCNLSWYLKNKSLSCGRAFNIF